GTFASCTSVHHLAHTTCFSITVPATTEIYTLSLHDALPISHEDGRARAPLARPSLSHLLTSCFSTSAAPSTPTVCTGVPAFTPRDRKSTRLNSSHVAISYAVFCLKKKNSTKPLTRTIKTPPP